MKVLILGCNGMAGHVISIYMEESGHNVTGYAREKSRFVNTIVGDALNFEYLRGIIQNGGYDVVINCIGLLNQFAEKNHASAVMLNGYLPHFLTQITKDLATKIIHMSTDCVFSGKTGRYTEVAVPDGELFYDRSKAIGELNDGKNITLRNSIVGPDIKPSGIGLLNWFMQQNEPVNGFRKVIWTGQTTLQLAKTMEAAMESKAHGLYNTVPNTSISKYDLLQLFNQYIRKKEIEIIPMDTFVSDKSLVRERYEDFNFEIPNYITMVQELGEWMRDHKALYPHYGL